MSRPIACPFSVRRSRSFFRPVRKVSNRMHSPMHTPGRPLSFPRVWKSKECQKPDPIRCRRALETHPNCIQTCTNYAPNGHLWCVSKTSRTLQDRPPAMEGRHPRAGGNPGVVRNRSQVGAEGCPSAPRNAPRMHSNVHELCTKHALVARFVGSTHPTQPATLSRKAGFPRPRERRGRRYQHETAACLTSPTAPSHLYDSSAGGKPACDDQ